MLLYVLLSLLITGSIISATLAYVTARSVDVLGVVTLSISTILLSVVEIQTRRPMPRPSSRAPGRTILVVIAVTSLVATVAYGLNDGQRARHTTFLTQREHFPVCASFVALRPIGDLYLAIGPDGAHRLIDRDCRAKMEIARPRPIIAEHKVWPILRRVFLRPSEPRRRDPYMEQRAAPSNPQ